ncbi:hypothetical protein PIB30_044554 [Stylosanthes scabra]|uniref:Uncharacterized protein n=1 Tax=Stylosanthes scabra TaxID=79078 RepID=A0ABU6UFL9_9FABA|nr:hypothetical protein [Stylosanthes scabra]
MENEEEDEAEDEEVENDWLYELLKELANSDDEEDEERQDESEEEDEDESTKEDSEDEFVEEGDQAEEEAREEDRDKGKIFFINTLVKEKKNEEEVPIKCEDPGPCLVTCKIRGVSILDCLYDPGACGNIMPFEVYELLDLVSVAGIAKDVLVKIIMLTKGDKGGKPQVLLGRPFLKTAGFKLIYYDEIFTFEVGNVIKIFHLPPPPNPWKKGLHQLQQDKGKKIKDRPWKEAKGRTRKEKKAIIKPNHFKEKRKKGKTKDNKVSDQKKKKNKRDRSGTKEKEEKKLAEVESEKATIKCSSFSGLNGKVKALKDVKQKC